MDWQIYEGSTIERMPRLLQFPALLARAALVGGRQRVAPLREHHHRGDGISTRHNDGFMADPAFRRGYARAVAAAGWDYRIPYRVHQAIWCARTALPVGGDLVELGTGRGFLMSAVLAALGAELELRGVHLFDTFSSRNLVDGRQISRTVNPYYATSFEDVRANFAEWPNVRLYQGDVFDTVPPAPVERVAFLHIDMNCVAPEIFGLRHFWPLMPPGGVVLLDDYAHGDCRDQYRAMNEAAADLGAAILSTPTGQGIIVK